MDLEKSRWPAGEPLPEDELYTLRHENAMDEKDIADELGTTRNKVHYWLDKYDINHPRQDLTEDRLRELYVDQELTIYEIASMHHTFESTVRSRMDKYGIERRTTAESLRSDAASFEHDERGYERWRAYDPQHGNVRMRVHRLAAIAWFGVDAVSGNVVHHKNEIKWDNREDNLEVMSNSEHAKLHADRRYGNTDGRDDVEVRVS